MDTNDFRQLLQEKPLPEVERQMRKDLVEMLEFYRNQVLGRQEPKIRYAIGGLLKRMQEKQ